MAEVTGIAWTDATFNPWIGCTKVGPGCDHCYAEAMDKHRRWGGDTHWGPGKPRMRTSASNWRKPLTWQRHAENGLLPDGKTPHGGRRPRVFCASLADVFDMEAPDAWRLDLFELIHLTAGLDWLLLTKRIVRVKHHLHCLMPNVWIGATIVNQEEADRDVPRLLALPAAVRFVSYEPAIGPVNWRLFPGLDWIIVGGESTQGAPARPFDLDWARKTIEQARGIGAAPFVKQLGSAPRQWRGGNLVALHTDGPLRLKDRAGAEPAEWPEDLRVQEFPA